MKLSTVVRLYYLVIVALLVGWCINLYEALAQSPVDWRDAAGVPLLVTIFVTVTMLTRARTKLSADPGAYARIAGRYVVAGLAVAGLVAVVLLGYRTHG